MRTFKIPCTWECYGIMYVDAESLEEAIEIAEADDSPLPDGDYVDASFQVEHELLDIINKEEL